MEEDIGQTKNYVSFNFNSWTLKLISLPASDYFCSLLQGRIEISVKGVHVYKGVEVRFAHFS